MSTRNLTSSVKWQVILISIGSGALYWIIDSFIDAFLFHENTLVSQLISPSQHEVFVRAVAMGLLFLVVSLSFILNIQRKIEKSLRESEKLYKTLAEAADDMIFIIDREDNVRYVNITAAKQFGCKPEELIGKKRGELFPPDVAGRQQQHLQSVFETGKSVYVEDKIVFPDREIWIGASLAPISNEAGEVSAVMGVSRDITVSKKAEERIRDISLQWQTTFNAINDAIFIADAEGRILRCNKAFANLVNKQESEIIGRTCHDVVHGTEYFIDGCPFVAAKDTHKREVVELEAGNKWFSVTVDPVLNDSGEIISYVHSMSDITGSRRAGEKLRTSEERFRSLAENIDQVFWFTELNPEKVLYVSPAFERIWGVPAEELYGNPRLWVDLIHIDDRQHVQEAFEAFINSIGITHYKVEYRLKRQDGEIRWIYDRGTFIPTKEGQPQRISGVAEDITERKKAEEVLRKSETNLKLYQNLIDQSHDSIEVLDPETGSFLNVNKRTCEDLGYTREELLSMKVFDIDPMVKPADFPKIMEGFRRMGGGIWQGVHLRKNGSTFPVEVSLRLVQLDRSYIVAVARDITERKKMEERIFQIKQDWEDTFNVITDMITVHDEDFNIIRYNKAAEKILGLSFLNVKQEKCYQFYHGTECPPAGCPSCMTFKTGVPATVEVFEPHLNMFIEIRAIPRFDSEHNIIGLIHVVRDITEHRKLESELRQSQKMEAVGQLAGGVAHDFNNIITAIIGYASIMKMKAGQDDFLRGLSDNLLSASEKAANLVRSLLAFSRKQVSNPEPVKINDIIKSIEKLLSMAAGEDIELKMELTPPASPPPLNLRGGEGELIVTADIVQMEQVMMNLCTNARDAMDGRGTLTIKTGAAELTGDFIAAHGYGEEGRYALISVSDTGVGMDENTRERIFEPFFTTKEFGKGTGLGLSIVYGIVKQHKGYITCQSEPGQGTTFNIYLPVIKAAMKEVKRIEQSGPAGAARTILFAEDEEKFRKLTRQMLESSGYNVIEAVDGTDAVNKFKENNDIDLLLFDIIMPRMSGKEAYEKIRKIRPDVKALFISGYPADFTDRYGVFEEGMNFISKPVPPAALLRRIREALDNERAE